MEKKIAVHVEGVVTKCNNHWHARVDFQGQDQILSAACVTEEDAQEVLQFVQEVVMALVAAGGGNAYVSDGTEKVQ